MSNEIYSRCGMRCDLCLIYRPNGEKEDRREKICTVFKKVFEGYNPDPNTIICDGCISESENAVLLSAGECKTRPCVIKKGLRHCGYCSDYPCDIFPAEPSHDEFIKSIDVE
jgi:hypothetical protein